VIPFDEKNRPRKARGRFYFTAFRVSARHQHYGEESFHWNCSPQSPLKQLPW